MVYMAYGLQFIIVGEQEQFMIMSMDQPRTSLLNNFIVVCALALYGMLLVVLYDGLRYT